MALSLLKTGSLIDQAAEMLTDYIVSEKIQTGEFLPTEQELGRMIGVGRSTLRESIKILESRGLVRRFHGQGVKVVNESEKATSDMLQLSIKRSGSGILDLIEVRNIFEVQAAALAAQRASLADLVLIEQALLVMQARNVSHKAYVQADIDFHLAIAKATHNKVLILMLETVRPLLHDVIVATLKPGSLPEQSLHYHERIFNAIKNKDANGAAKAMVEHLEGTESIIKSSKKFS